MTEKGGGRIRSILSGRWRLKDVLGCGGSGTVYLASAADGGLAAVKEVKKADSQAVHCLRREFFMSGALKMAAAPVVYGFFAGSGRDEAFYFLIKEYIDGESLYSRVFRHGRLSLAETTEYGLSLCRQLSDMHHMCPTPAVFLDLQPKNIIIEKSSPRLIDFGQARFVTETVDRNELFATRFFCAPELAGSHFADPRSDVYAIGAVLSFMRGKACPGKDPLGGIISKCTKTDPVRRFADAGEVAAALEKI